MSVRALPALLLGLALLAPRSSPAGQAEFPKLIGPYFGLKPAGKAPELFAPLLFNSARYSWYHSIIVFSPDGQEAFWQAGQPSASPDGRAVERLWMADRLHGQWSEPRPFPFFEGEGDSPAISPDGKRLYFLSTHPIPGMKEKRRKENIWVSDRIGNEWSNPIPLPQTINALDMHWQISLDRTGNLYFGVWKVDLATNRTLEHDIYFARFEGGLFLAPERLGPEINGLDTRQYSPHVSPEGDYLLFTRTTKKAPFRTSIHLSYRGPGGLWMPPLDLSDVLQIQGGNAKVTPDGRFMFFLKSGREVFWMDAGFIIELKPKDIEKRTLR